MANPMRDFRQQMRAAKLAGRPGGGAPMPQKPGGMDPTMVNTRPPAGGALMPANDNFKAQIDKARGSMDPTTVNMRPPIGGGMPVTQGIAASGGMPAGGPRGGINPTMVNMRPPAGGGGGAMAASSGAPSPAPSGGMMKRGGKVKSMSSGGMSSKSSPASKRGDGIAQRGKTKGRFI